MLPTVYTRHGLDTKPLPSKVPPPEPDHGLHATAYSRELTRLGAISHASCRSLRQTVLILLISDNRKQTRYYAQYIFPSIFLVAPE